MIRVGHWWYRGSLLQFAAAAFLLQTAPPNPGSQQAPPAPSQSTDKQTGSGVYKVGGEVTAPVPVDRPEPKYSEKARRAKYQGTVVVGIVVGASGDVTDARIVRPLGLGLDEKALETVRTWKFKPAMRNGVPVPVRVIVEVNFRLYVSCRVPIAFAEIAGDDPNGLAWGRFPQDALNWWTAKGGVKNFPRICLKDRNLAKYAVVSRGSSGAGAMRIEVYQLVAGKIQPPALFVSKETTSGGHAFRDAVKYINHEASKSQ